MQRITTNVESTVYSRLEDLARRRRVPTAHVIREALEHHGGNVSRAARALGIGRNTLYAKMRKLGIC